MIAIFIVKCSKSVNDGINYLQVLIEQDNLFFDTLGSSHCFSAMSTYRWIQILRLKPVHD